MIRLLYFSKFATALASEDLKDILAVARRKNKERGVTGALVTGGDVFLQILEGPEQSVLSLYLQIKNDKRHKDVEIMRVTPIMDRLFEDWSMEWFDATPLHFVEIMKFKTEHFAHEEPKQFLGALRGLIDLLTKKK